MTYPAGRPSTWPMSTWSALPARLLRNQRACEPSHCVAVVGRVGFVSAAPGHLEHGLEQALDVGGGAADRISTCGGPAARRARRTGERK